MTFQEIRLGALATITVSNVDKHSREDEPPVRLCNYTDVYYNHTLDQSRDYMAATASVDQIAKYRLRTGDVVITKDSETADDIGIPALITETADDFVCGYHLAIIRPDKTAADPRYLNWVLGSRYLASQFESIAPGVTRVGLKTSRIKTLNIPVPGGVAEQARIADYLDRETATIDTLIEKQRLLVEALRERRTSLIVRKVSGSAFVGLLKPSVSSWRTVVPDHWNELPLKRVLADVQSGYWGAEPEGDERDCGVVRVADFDRQRLRAGDPPTTRSISPTEYAKSALRRGDLLMEKSGGTARNPVGFVVSYEGHARAICANFITRIRPRPGQDSRFWLYALNASYISGLTWKSVNQTTGIQNLNVSAFLSEVFPAPPLDEQRAIVDHLDAETTKIDALIAKAERFIELAQERRAALITTAVTGQIEIPEAGAAA